MAGATSTLARLPGVGRLLQALGVNSVPALGLFEGGWTSGTAANPAGGVHGSISDPPQADSISPTGTPSFW